MRTAHQTYNYDAPVTVYGRREIYYYDAKNRAFSGRDGSICAYDGPSSHMLIDAWCRAANSTGKERDSESGLDNFGARYDSSSMGRFMTPDWSARPTPVPFADLANPQSLNLYSYVTNNPLNRTDPLGHDWFYVDKKWQWQKGHTYHDQNGNATKDKGYAGLLVATATGMDKKTGATTYNLTLYDQDKKVFQGSGFSGGRDQNGNMHPSIQDGNYTMRLDIRDPNGPNTINPNSLLNNPPVFYGIQKMHDIDAGNGMYWPVVGAYGQIRARLNPWPGGEDGNYFHGQSNGYGYTHGCLCYGTDTRIIDYMWNNMGATRVPAAVDVPVVQP
jgi:RHS repeat-associated protein